MIAGTTSELVQAANNSSIVSLSSSRTLRCSYVHPPGPGEDPLGALFRLVKYMALSKCTGLKIQHLLSQWPDDLLRAPVLQSTESVLIPRSQSGSCETLSCPRHLSETNRLACLMRPCALEFGCWDTMDVLSALLAWRPPTMSTTVLRKICQTGKTIRPSRPSRLLWASATTCTVTRGTTSMHGVTSCGRHGILHCDVPPMPLLQLGEICLSDVLGIPEERGTFSETLPPD